jgi:hypothetical protein
VFHSTADGETALGECQGGIAGALLIGREYADEAVARADGTLAHADFTGIGEKDFGSCKVDAHGHAITPVPPIPP